MDFDFSEDQRQLEDTLQRFVQRDYGFERRRKLAASSDGWSREAWQQLADIGALAINVPEAHGGMGFGPVETLLAMKVFGPALLLEPFVSSAVIATALLAESGDEAAQADLLPKLAAGETIAVLAHFEPSSRNDSGLVATRAVRSGDGFVLDGHKAVVVHAGAADELLVSARTQGNADDADGVTLFRVSPKTPGVVQQPYPLIDGQRGAEVFLRSAYVPATARIGAEGGALPAIERALDVGLAALLAESVGVQQALVDATVEYLKTRQQFGQPIGRFQALQHRAADMVLHLEQSRSMSYLAALRCTLADKNARRAALSAAKVVVNQGGRFIGQQSVQLHGGMGMTDELQVSHWFKRLIALEATFGDTDTHLQRFAHLRAAA